MTSPLDPSSDTALVISRALPSLEELLASRKTEEGNLTSTSSVLLPPSERRPSLFACATPPFSVPRLQDPEHQRSGSRIPSSLRSGSSSQNRYGRSVGPEARKNDSQKNDNHKSDSATRNSSIPSQRPRGCSRRSPQQFNSQPTNTYPTNAGRASVDIKTEHPIRFRSESIASFQTSLTAPRNSDRLLRGPSSQSDDLVSINYRTVTLDPKLFSAESVRKEAVKIILKYLDSKQFREPPKFSSLLHPQGLSTYTSIITFLMAQYDPMTKEDHTPLEEKVPLFFKDAGYPTNLAKSHMKSPTTPVTWPQHLAAMAWLCCILMFNKEWLSVEDLLSSETRQEEQDLNKSTTHHLVPRTPRAIGSGIWTEEPGSARHSSFLRERNVEESPSCALLRVVRDAYRQQGSKEFVDKSGIKNIFETAMKRWKSKIEIEIDKLKEENEQVFKTLQNKEMESMIPQKLEERVQKSRGDILRIHDATRKMHHEHAQKEKLSFDLRIESARLDERVKQLETELEALKMQIGKQEINKQQLGEFRREISELRSKCLEASKQRAVATELNSSLAAEIKRLEEEAVADFREVTSALSELDNEEALPRLDLDELHEKLEQWDRKDQEATVESWPPDMFRFVQMNRLEQKEMTEKCIKNVADYDEWISSCRIQIEQAQQFAIKTKEEITKMETQTKHATASIKKKLLIIESVEQNLEGIQFDLTKQKELLDDRLDEERNLERLTNSTAEQEKRQLQIRLEASKNELKKSEEILKQLDSDGFAQELQEKIKSMNETREEELQKNIKLLDCMIESLSASTRQITSRWMECENPDEQAAWPTLLGSKCVDQSKSSI